jgi:Mn2+/Fe2+ NRAMP family transporter
MIGAGAVATRLLAGAWFGFDLLWVALYVIPMVIFTLDSASRVAVFSLVLVIYGVVGLLR